MLSRAFTKPKRSPKYGENSKSQSIDDYQYDEDYIAGWFMDDLPLIFCGNQNNQDGRESHEPCGSNPTLREVFRCSVGVMGESRLGMSEKVVMLNGKICMVKRFRKMIVKRREFGKRLEKLALISRRCEYLVPVTAYLYAKRIKFVLSSYYPMGSLADLLTGGRKPGNTALDWNQRLTIIIHIARAISFIHRQPPDPQEKNMQVNVHGNIKASNVMINIDFTARLSDYGFTQLADRVEVSDTGQRSPSPPPPENYYCNKLCKKGDVFNFGIIVLDMLGGPTAPELIHCIMENMEEITTGEIEFFEISVEGRERKRALEVLNIALACTNRLAEARPSMEKILLRLADVTDKFR